MHRRHHVGVGVEGAAGETHVDRAIVTVALHVAVAAADDADGQAAAEALAVGHEVGAHAEILLRAARSEAEADENLVEDEDDAAPGAHLAQTPQPRRIGLAIEAGAARAVDERGIPGRRRVGMHGLRRD